MVQPTGVYTRRGCQCANVVRKAGAREGRGMSGEKRVRDSGVALIGPAEDEGRR